MNARTLYQELAVPGKSRDDIERLRMEGLVLLHNALQFALETGCKPHSGKDLWHEAICQLEEACVLFLDAATPGVPGGLSSNVRLAALTLIEASSLRIDAGLENSDSFENAQYAAQLLEGLKEPLGTMAAKVVSGINSRAFGYDLQFNLQKLLLSCSSVVGIPRVQSIIEDRANDITAYSMFSHAFPERDLILSSLLHRSVPFSSWRRIYEKNQREELPHFELEIAAIIVAYVIAVATAVSGAVLTDEIKDRIKRRKKIKEKAQEAEDEIEIDEKLKYLLQGFAFREFFKSDLTNIDLETFNEVLRRLRAGESASSSQRETLKQFETYRESLPEDLRYEAHEILARLEELIADFFLGAASDEEDDE